MKIINAFWFTECGSTRPIGIIIGEDDITKERKAYIGSGYGFDEGVDAGHIAEMGAKFTLNISKNISSQLEPPVMPNEVVSGGDLQKRFDIYAKHHHGA